MAVVLAAAVVVGVVSCRAGPEPPEADIRTAGCEVKPAGRSGPVQDPNGPYYHQVVVARTTDGITLTNAWQALDHASVPDGAVGPGGFPLIYYVNGADGPVWVALLLDDSVNVLGPISLDGVSRPSGVVDPDATHLSDGRIRLAYLSNLLSSGTSVSRAICIAESADGVHFSVVGTALALGAGGTDPSVTQLADGSWLMGISLGQQTILARSADGLTFTPYDTVGFGGVPEVAALADGRVRLYVCHTGIESYLTSDRGVTWQRETTVVAPGTGGKQVVCDPSLVAGAGVFLYKTAN